MAFAKFEGKIDGEITENHDRTFEILNVILHLFYRFWDFIRKWPLQNLKEKLTEKLPKIMRS